jgi:hypothetical protein
MAVTSTTLSGVNVFQFSGAVTDAEIGTAFAGTISEGRYVLNRAIYLDQTADLTNVTGGFLIDFGTQVLPAIILDTRRDRTKSVFKNFVFYQRVGLSVPNRNSFVRTWNGTGFANAGSGLSIDGLAQNGGGFFYAVQGVNPAGGDNRWLNEMAFAGPMANNTVASQQFALEELQVCMGASTTIKGMTFEKAYGFPQLSPALANANVTVYRSNMNTESLVNGGLIPIRLFPSFNRWSSVCYVDSYVTRLGADITTRLVDAFGSNATSRAHFTVLNNYTRESWFGASKTNMAITTWGAANTIHGGVLKKLQFINGSGGVVKSYDSRSTTASQPCKFSETGFFDFLDPNLAPTVDSEGKIELVHIGAIASGVTAAIARYAEQKYTFQKFGYRVIVTTVDMTSGDNDLSAFTPISLTTQNSLTRTQAQIQAATTISNFKELLEELHVLAIVSSGSDSYSAAFGGNFFSLDGRSINTEFDSIVIDPNATSKIAYNGVTNTLTIKSSVISSTTDVNEWRNEGGTFTFLNGAQINGVFADNDGSRVNVFNLDPENFGITWFLRYKKTSDTAWTELSGTGNSTTILADLDEYDMMLRVPGYQWREIVFDTNESLSIDANLSYHVSANNTPQYTMAFDANLESKINFDPVANSVSVENETGVITQPGFAELYQATERIQHLPALVWTFNAPITANSTSQKILIPDGNPITFFLTEGSNASVKVTCPVIHADTGESADDRVRGNSDGFSIILGSPATAESAGLQSAIVSDILAKIGGVGYSIENDNLQKINEKVQTLENTDLTGIATTDNVNDVLDAVNNIEPTDISALALEASVQQSLTAIDLTLKDADYVAPDNTTIGQIKSKVDTLENYDDTETQTKLDTLQTTVDNIDVDFTPVLDAIDLTLKETDYTAPDNATIAEIQTKVDTLENTDITPVLDAVQDNFEVTKIISVEVQKLN